MPKLPTARRATERLSAVQKALRILEVVAAAPGPMSMAAIERATGLPRPTVHRVTKELIRYRYVEPDPVLRQHFEGARLVSLSIDVLRSRSPLGRRREIIDEVARETGEACHFGLLRGHHLLLVDHVDSPAPLGVRYNDGEMLPAHCAAGGKLLLSILSDEEREAALGSRALIRMTEQTICDRRRLLAALAAIKESGVGTEEGEHILGVVGIAVPVQSRGGQVVGALGMVAPQARVPLAKALTFVPSLKAAATRLAEALDTRQSR
jgi:DNA-binding IclR family transcriptional regulator